MSGTFSYNVHKFREMAVGFEVSQRTDVGSHRRFIPFFYVTLPPFIEPFIRIAPAHCIPHLGTIELRIGDFYDDDNIRDIVIRSKGETSAHARATIQPFPLALQMRRNNARVCEGVDAKMRKVEPSLPTCSAEYGYLILCAFIPAYFSFRKRK